MQSRSTSLAGMAAVGLLTLAPMTAQALTIEIGGDVRNRPGRGGSLGEFQGLLTIEEFELRDGQIVAIGTLTGEVLNRAGRVTRTIEQTVELVLEGFDFDVVPSPFEEDEHCVILFLHLEGLFLDVLGLVVDLDEVILEIRAEPNGLLGTLLAGLLCGPLDQLGDLLDLLGAFPDRLDELVGLLEDILEAIALADALELDVMNNLTE